ASLALFVEARVDRLRAKSVALTGFMDTLVRPLEPEVRIITPAAAAERGCQLSLRIAGGAARGRRVFDALRQRGIVGDWRSPDIIRVAAVPLYNRFEEVLRFAQQLEAALRATP
ncbi:MAG: hypothetical protein WA747_08930, partial [Steroidobacteraceae bacterium]